MPDQVTHKFGAHINGPFRIKMVRAMRQQKDRVFMHQNRPNGHVYWSSLMRIAVILTSLLILAACDVPFVPLI